MEHKDKQFIITFAGPIGSSKTPIAYHLSQVFGLPILNNDSIRTEVIEDIGRFDELEYESRRESRLSHMLNSESSFIYDASVDRKWDELKQLAEEHGYRIFLVSLDLSKEFLGELYTNKNYQESLQRLDQNWQDHQDFLQKYDSEVSIAVHEDEFKTRLALVESALNKWLNTSS